MAKIKRRDPRTSVKFDGHSFNRDAITKFKTVEEFLAVANAKATKKTDHSSWFEGDENREAKLREVYKLANTPIPADVKEEDEEEAATVTAPAPAKEVKKEEVKKEEAKK